MNIHDILVRFKLRIEKAPRRHFVAQVFLAQQSCSNGGGHVEALVRQRIFVAAWGQGFAKVPKTVLAPGSTVANQISPLAQKSTTLEKS